MRTVGVHKKRVRVRSYKCEICPEQYKSQKELNAHLAADHPAVEHTCKNRKGPCSGKKFSSQAAVKKHKHVAHSDDKAHKCPKCDSSFAFASDLRDHNKVHSDERLHSCASRGCTSTFKHQSGLVRHAKVHQGQVFKCVQCPQEFTTEYLLQQHVSNGHGPVDHYKCQCGFVCKHRAQMIRHKKSCK